MTLRVFKLHCKFIEKNIFTTFFQGYHHATKFTRFLLHLIGGWPHPDSFWTSVHFACVVSTIFCFETASQTVIMIKNATDLNFLIQIYFDMNIPATISIVKLSNLWLHRYGN